MSVKTFDWSDEISQVVTKSLVTTFGLDFLLFEDIFQALKDLQIYKFEDQLLLVKDLAYFKVELLNFCLEVLFKYIQIF